MVAVSADSSGARKILGQFNLHLVYLFSNCPHPSLAFEDLFRANRGFLPTNADPVPTCKLVSFLYAIKSESRLSSTCIVWSGVAHGRESWDINAACVKVGHNTYDRKS